ncbi:sterol desaturase family protein [Myxococcota bacterium]|nr:sterol desaturase family protein [Myxococcota bacterium]
MPPWLVEIYRDPRFVPVVLGGTVVSMAAFAAFAAPLTWLAWRDPERLRRYRIQRARPPKEQKLVGPSIVRWLVNNLVMTIVAVLAWPLLSRASFEIGARPSVAVAAVQVVAFVYLDDVLFYFAHRALHTRWLFRHVHALHHQIRTPWAITGHYSHPVEYVITGSLVLVGPALVGAHVYTLWVWIALRQWEAAEGHSGYDFPWSPTKLFPGSDGARHHDAHHEAVTGNYAGFFAHVDKLLGTLSKGYVPWQKTRG